MKQLLIAVCLIVAAFTASAQASEKVKQAFSAQELAQKSNDEVAFLNFYADKCYVVHESGKTGQTYPLLSTVAPSFTMDSFNPLMVQGSRDQHRFFTVDGTNKVVQLYSESYARILFRDFKNNQKKAAGQ